MIKSKILLFIVCFSGPALLVSGVVGSRYAPHYSTPERLIIFAFTLGVLVVLGDLWMRKISRDEKIWWSVLIVLLSVLFMPLYWYKFIHLNKVDKSF